MHRWLPPLGVLYPWSPSFINRLVLPRLSCLLSASPYDLSATPPFTSFRAVLSWKVSRTFTFSSSILWYYIIPISAMFSYYLIFFTASHPISFLVFWYFYGELDFSTYFLCWFLLIYFFFQPLLWTLSDSLALQQTSTPYLQQSCIASLFQYNFISEYVREVQRCYL